MVFWFRKKPLETVEVWNIIANTSPRTVDNYFKVATKIKYEGRVAEEMYERKLFNGYVVYGAREFQRLFGVVFRTRRMKKEEIPYRRRGFMEDSFANPSRIQF